MAFGPQAVVAQAWSINVLVSISYGFPPVFSARMPRSSPHSMLFGLGGTDTPLDSRNGFDWLRPIREVRLSGHRTDSGKDPGCSLTQ